MALFSFSATFLLPPASVTTSYNKAIRSLIFACLIYHRRFAPGSLRLPTNGRTAFAAAMRMIARVHDRSADAGTTAHVTRSPGLADALVFMVNIPNLANCG